MSYYTLMRFHQSRKADAMPRPKMATTRPPGSRWRLPPRLELCSPRAAFFDILRLFNDPQAPGLGPGAGPDDEPAEGQGCLGRVAEPHGDHGWLEGQAWGAVHADWGRYGGHEGAYRLVRGSGTCPGTRRLCAHHGHRAEMSSLPEADARMGNAVARP
jgi:hypothetical protein